MLSAGDREETRGHSAAGTVIVSRTGRGAFQGLAGVPPPLSRLSSPPRCPLTPPHPLQRLGAAGWKTFPASGRPAGPVPPASASGSEPQEPVVPAGTSLSGKRVNQWEDWKCRHRLFVSMEVANMKQKPGSPLGTLSILPRFHTCLARAFHTQMPTQLCLHTHLRARDCVHAERPEVTASLRTVLNNTVVVVHVNSHKKQSRDCAVMGVSATLMLPTILQ